LAAELEPDGVLLLSGDLGAGKTVLAQGVACGLGLDPDSVQSPSYTLIAVHEGQHSTLIHVDLYRLEPEETHALGLEEQFAGPGVKVVEWAERLPVPPPAALALTIRRIGPGEAREILELETE
jgi:tRNA threonylcarbamoyladenosine biosynthesis protein TsaE